MRIQDLIDRLEQMKFDSDEGDDTEVSVVVHAMQHNGSGFNIGTQIDDVSISFGHEHKDIVEIEIVLDGKALDDLQGHRIILEENDLLG